MGNIGWTEIIVIGAVVLLLFGANRLPEVARSLGKAIREFKKSLKEIESDVSGNEDERKSDTPPNKT